MEQICLSFIINRRNMEFSQTSENYCHTTEPYNYFISSKMPVKDHLQGLKSTSSSFKPHQQCDQKTKTVMGESSNHLTSNHLGQIQTMKDMKLLAPKQLRIVNHAVGKQNSNVCSHHDRQTNAGYSRNALGGFYTS